MAQPKTKRGWVYILESRRKTGQKKRYVGQTGRTVYQRVGEHIREVKKPKSRTWIGRGVWVRLLGSFFSNNRFKAERRMKRRRRTVTSNR